MRSGARGGDCAKGPREGLCEGPLEGPLEGSVESPIQSNGGVDAADLRARAVDVLARREHSRRELRDKLLRRGFDAGDVDPVLDVLGEENLLSDRRFAVAYADSRAARGFGPVRIIEELRRRGVDGGARDAACDPSDPRWAEAARRVRDRKFGATPPEDLRERARQARFLTQRGFTRGQVAAALRGDPDDPDV